MIMPSLFRKSKVSSVMRLLPEQENNIFLSVNVKDKDMILSSVVKYVWSSRKRINC